jgi:hypothetical protein
MPDGQRFWGQAIVKHVLELTTKNEDDSVPSNKYLMFDVVVNTPRTTL